MEIPEWIPKSVIFLFLITLYLVTPSTLIAESVADMPRYESQSLYEQILLLQQSVQQIASQYQETNPSALTLKYELPNVARQVPFYSQFTDVSDPGWQKVACGIASLAMVIDYFTHTSIDVDELLNTGLERRAFLSDAGWIHAGLIDLANDYGLDGASMSFSDLSTTEATKKLQHALSRGPVLASVHYTFEPTNPIPHLVVVTDIIGDNVYYNDPADVVGNGSIPLNKFQRAWKKRFIAIQPV